MKYQKLFFVLGILLFFLAVQVVSAHNTYSYDYYYDSDYYHDDYPNADDDVIVVIKYPQDTLYSYNSQYYENPERYPVYSYGNGYSYRATYEYQEMMYERSYNSYHESGYYSAPVYYPYPHVVYQTAPSYYYTYDDYLRSYSAHECYYYPPSDKLVYIKCP